MLAITQYKSIMPYADRRRIDIFAEPLNQAMREYEINTRFRISAFLANIAHESGSLRYVIEITSGSAYEGRKDLGNNQPGDGVRFKGRGLIQITGRANYLKCSKALGMDFISKPELLELPEWATKSAAWFWQTHGLNEIADHPETVVIHKGNAINNFELVCIRINGGWNGMEDRKKYYKKALEVIKI